jgi:oligopeptide/dipeptide ABC transporter ATP-binding protein
MEQGPSAEIHDRPRHPYTQALLAAVPVAVPALQAERRRLRASMVSASTANAEQPAREGCPFAPRCSHVASVCWQRRPTDTRIAEVIVACHIYDAESGHPEANSGFGPVMAPEVDSDGRALPSGYSSDSYPTDVGEREVGQPSPASLLGRGISQGASYDKRT